MARFLETRFPIMINKDGHVQSTKRKNLFSRKTSQSLKACFERVVMNGDMNVILKTKTTTKKTPNNSQSVSFKSWEITQFLH